MTKKSASWKRDFRKRKMDIIRSGFGSKCQICGYDKCTTALEFHHINPDEKENSPTQWVYHDLNKVLDEIKGCVLVCSNCHREIHAGLVEQSVVDSLPRFDESVLEGFNTSKSDPKQVQQFSIDGDLIATYSSIKSTSKDGFDPKAVSKVVLGKMKSHKGFIWKKVEDEPLQDP